MITGLFHPWYGVHQQELERLVKRLDYCLQGQGHSKVQNCIECLSG